MTAPRGNALEVWGDPIDHSRSPDLHAAAYAVLGLPWSYGRRRVDAEGFAGELAGLDAAYRGLSLTFPLKGVAFQAAAQRDRRAELTGAVNTLLLGDAAGPRGFNTDIGGIVRDLEEHGVTAVERARIVGAGATATSALVALAELGARDVRVVARRPEAIAPLRALGELLDVAVTGQRFEDPAAPADVTIATLPGGAPVDPAHAEHLAASGGLLYDVVYGHWPTVLAAAWADAGAPAVSGLGMLLHQAVLQIRLFVAGNVEAALPDEAAVLAAMRAAVT